MVAKEVENDAMAQSVEVEMELLNVHLMVEGVVAMVENNYDDLVVGLQPTAEVVVVKCNYSELG
jgi:hypothetical protein